jgi:hypothetical protein
MLGLSCLQKMGAAFKIIAYEVAADATDDYVRVGESTALKCLRSFSVAIAVVEIFGPEYLRLPNEHDTIKLLVVGESRGFSAMLGSIDCMHWGWKNCPTTWHGMYRGHKKELTIILKTVTSKDLWIWHAFFGMSDSHNDINVLKRSLMFARLVEGQDPHVNYKINGNDYSMSYYLADGIYLS